MHIKRLIFNDLLTELNEPEVLILIGARQVGKTYLLNELESYLRTRKKKTKYFNLELPNDSRLFNKDILELYNEITNDVDFLLIDEFQYFENASKFFKSIFDDRKVKIKIIASGSSALQMHKHLRESLAGRKVEKIIYPLSFKEYKQTQESFDKYLVFGGLPGLAAKQTTKKQIDLLNNLLETYILKDVKSLIKEENVSAFNDLVYLLANYQGQIVSTNNLANELRINNKTVERYLTILEQTFVLSSLPSYSKNLSNELKKSKKYFLYDLGIRSIILNNFKTLKEREDKGVIYETYVHNFLKQNCPKNFKLRFWRTRNGEEVDFVLLKNLDPYIFEVKSKLSKLEIPEGVKKFIRTYPRVKEAYVINEHLSDLQHYENVIVKFIILRDLEFNSDIKDIFSNVI